MATSDKVSRRRTSLRGLAPAARSLAIVAGLESTHFLLNETGWCALYPTAGSLR
jgi:hypothetical protein